ncbi:MAG: hypothetical protein NXH81_07955 [Halieaceae bacterium]|jgi:hypothetical protein|uniref:hypothetical protein n=1 Tax=Haliea alexandrii TaxID=2448162 RepID=UPI001304BAE0|nr:hypothetical protein [Haliea alexandrii]MCR9185312.1 hypothetical protein [Halieaceae bacterium]
MNDRNRAIPFSGEARMNEGSIFRVPTDAAVLLPWQLLQLERGHPTALVYDGESRAIHVQYPDFGDIQTLHGYTLDHYNHMLMLCHSDLEH